MMKQLRHGLCIEIGNRLLLDMTIRRIYWFSLPLILSISLVRFSVAQSGYTGVREFNTMESTHKINDVLELIKRYYVERPEGKELADAAIIGLLAKLDPHSIYMPPKTVEKSDEEYGGSYQGVGLTYTKGKKDTIIVDGIAPDGPAERVGLQSGDRIVAIGGETVAGDADSISKKLRGPKGTRVDITVVRFGLSEPLEFSITRDIIPLHSVSARAMIDNETGYLALGKFSATTHEETRKALAELRSMGMKKLVLDLRNNGGGFMEQAVRIADEFIGGEKTIVYSKGRVPVFDEYDVSRSGDMYEKLPLVVLVDGGSASASEILSGALQDLDRAPLVGTTTFGKGLVQRQFALGDGSAVRLTIAKYYTPSGRSIQRPYSGSQYTEGISDVKDEEADNFTHTADLASGDTTRPKFTTPTGRTIYGGGGITPDFIVKSDTVTSTTLRLLSSSILWDYVTEYIAASATDIKTRYTDKSFPDGFKLPMNAFALVRAKAEEKKVKIDEVEYELDKTRIDVMLRGEIGRQLFGNNTKAALLLKVDKQFQKAYSLFGEAEKMAVMFK